MREILRRRYLTMVIPVVLLFGARYLLHGMGILSHGRFQPPPFWYPVLFTLAAATGVAGPILIRTLFANVSKGKKQVAAEDFLLFWKNILHISLITPYFAFTAVFCEFPEFYSGGMFLMALYALYYSYPSVDRISFDRKIFRVEELEQ